MRKLTLAVVDGIGGGIGSQIVERLRAARLGDCTIIALGTNAVAAQRMVDAGADRGASGENAIRVTIGSADFVVGPIGIVLPNAMMGETSPGMAEAVCNARGRKLLLPLSQPHIAIVGLEQKNVSDLIDEAVSLLARMVSETRAAD